MSVVALMYHRAQPGRYGNAPEMLDAHFRFIAARCACVLPGESLARGKINVCLTFDDGYYDFYAIVLPLLKKHGLHAVLAVVPALVPDGVEATAEERLAAVTDFDARDPDRRGLCSWRELQEITESGHGVVAAHGYAHRRLDKVDTDVHDEVIVPQTVLRARLGRPVDTFVFPYGRFSRQALASVRANYAYAFRIGGADNRSWNAPVLYRVDADRMTSPEALLAPHRRLSYRLRFYWNRVRGR